MKIYFQNQTNISFIDFVNKNPDSTPGFMPFRDGKSMCPGRFFAKNEIKICIAMLLRYMEYKFIETEKIPTQKPYRVRSGVAPPNEDIYLHQFKI
jgi:cytochrome P450